MTIKASSLLASIRQAYDEKWGYVWGTRGQVWTQAQQDKATRDMTRKYGQRWVGKRVADCSGLIKWAYQQHGGDIYHGSNTMFKQCVETGPLAGVVRIRRGTAVFQVSGGTRGHVGIYDGGGMVIEEHGTQAGIIKSPLSTWDEWGVLKDSDVSGEPWETFNILPADTLVKGSKGEVVRWYQRGLIELGYDLGKDGADGIFGTQTLSATRAFQYDNGLTSDGMAGKKTLTKVKELMEDDEPDEDTEVDFDEVVEPLTLEERVKRLEKAVFGQEGGEPNGS